MPEIELEFSVTADRTEVAANTDNEPLTTQLEVRLSREAMQNASSSIDTHICLVLDCSGSMEGEYIRAATDAAKLIVDCTAESNTISLVAFESKTRLLLSGMRATTQGKAKMREVIETLPEYVRGTTAMAEGIRRGTTAMRANPAAAQVMILLSDGIANVPGQAELAAREAADVGIQLYAVGLGTSFDYMHRLVAPSNGTVFEQADASALVDTFSTLAGRIERIAASQIELAITLSPGVSPGVMKRLCPHRTEIGKPSADADGVIRLKLGNVERDEVYRFELPLDLPRRRPGPQLVFDAKLIYHISSLGLERQERVAGIGVTYVARTPPVEPPPRERATPPAPPPRKARVRVAEATPPPMEPPRKARVRAAKVAPPPMGPPPIVAEPEPVPEPPAPRPERFDLVLTDAGEDAILVFREARDATGVSLSHVRDLLKAGGGALQEGLDRATAEALRDRLVAVGARAEVRRQPTSAPDS